jgi:N-methylhydantoinase A
LSFRLCIDIGGTFTDCVVADATGAQRIFKSPSTPDAFERGFVDVLQVAAEHYGLELRTFLGEVESIVHGSTVSTNALVEGKTRPVGFITNEGFPDILTLREAPRKRSFEWRLRYPEPYVPRSRTRTVRGRIAADGSELVPLEEADVHAAIAHFRKLDVEAVGICLLWSIVNGAHERRIREIIHSEWPGVPVTLSHELNPIPREYRRAIAAVIDASLSPIVSSYVQVLQTALTEAGYQR